MTHLTNQDKAELLEDARSPIRRREFAGMKARSKTLSPVEWIDFLTQLSRLTAEHTRDPSPILGDRFVL